MATDKNIINEQLSHMADRLMEEGKRIGEEPLIVEYDNGGGQSGVRENPFYPAYEKLLASYLKALAVAKDCCEDDPEVRTLDVLRQKMRVIS